MWLKRSHLTYNYTPLYQKCTCYIHATYNSMPHVLKIYYAWTRLPKYGCYIFSLVNFNFILFSLYSSHGSRSWDFNFFHPQNSQKKARLPCSSLIFHISVEFFANKRNYPRIELHARKYIRNHRRAEITRFYKPVSPERDRPGRRQKKFSHQLGLLPAPHARSVYFSPEDHILI